MQLIRWNPWSIDRFLDEDWDFPALRGVSRTAEQGLNLYETDDAIVAEAALPGVSEDRVDVTLDDGVVRITGSSEESQEDRGKRKYFISSMTRSFNYAFRLPQQVAANKEPMVEFDNGKLKIMFPKQMRQAPKKIKVSSKRKELKGK